MGEKNRGSKTHPLKVCEQQDGRAARDEWECLTTTPFVFRGVLMQFRLPVSNKSERPLIQQPTRDCFRPFSQWWSVTMKEQRLWEITFIRSTVCKRSRESPLGDLNTFIVFNFIDDRALKWHFQWQIKNRPTLYYSQRWTNTNCCWALVVWSPWSVDSSWPIHHSY